MGEADVFEHAIVHVPSITAESQTIHPKMKREFSEGVNLIEAIAHDSLPTLRNPAPWRYWRLGATDVICSTKTAFSTSRCRPPPRHKKTFDPVNLCLPIFTEDYSEFEFTPLCLSDGNREAFQR